MDYLMNLTLTPFLGRVFSEDPSRLVDALESISVRVLVGHVLLASRAAKVMMESPSHEDLTLVTIPWCIITGEHPHVEVVLRDIHKQKSSPLARLAGTDLSAPPREQPSAPRFEVRFPGAYLEKNRGKSASGAKQHLQKLKGRVVRSHYELKSGMISLIVETADPNILYESLRPLYEHSGEPIDIEPIVDWNAFLDLLRKIGRLSKAPVKPPDGCVDSPHCCHDIQPFAVPRGGTDRLHFTTWDTIEIPGMGEREIELSGFYEIERKNPTSSNWVDTELEIEMKKMEVSGQDELLGEVRAFLKPDVARSSGRVSAGTIQNNRPDGAKHCEMEAQPVFELKKLGAHVVSKTPIRLVHQITHIPPVGQGGGTGDIRIPLYDEKNLEGEPVAYLRRVRTHIGDFLTPSHDSPKHEHGSQSHP